MTTLMWSVVIKVGTRVSAVLLSMGLPILSLGRDRGKNVTLTKVRALPEIMRRDRARSGCVDFAALDKVVDGSVDIYRGSGKEEVERKW